MAKLKSSNIEEFLNSVLAGHEKLLKPSASADNKNRGLNNS